VCKDIFKVLERYDLDNAAVRLYYETHGVVSSDPAINITCYACSNNRYLLVLSNKTDAEKTATIDVSSLKKGDFVARNEYAGGNVPVNSGKLEITVAPRSFILIGF
jgi:6-phosphogluconolactonase (cycloisomerase 2 family)